MSFKARDGRAFSNAERAWRYDQSLADKGKRDAANAPGGYEWDHNIREHGPVLKSTIEYDGPGRWKHTAHHADGTKSESVHPEIHRADQVAEHYFGIAEPPPAIRTHQRARSQPTGPKEEERIAHEDQRLEEPER